MWNSITNTMVQASMVKAQFVQGGCKVEEAGISGAGLEKLKKEKSKKKKIEDEDFEIKQNRQSRLSRWSPQEDLLYMRFMKMNEKYFECENLRRTGKVFMHLSKAMNGVRTANQCKSHHQKMQKATPTGNIYEIIAYLQKKHSIGQVKTECTTLADNANGQQYQLSTTKKEIRIFVDLATIAIW